MDKFLKRRLKQGWQIPKLKNFEISINNINDFIKKVPNWKDYLHIIPGFSHATLRKLLVNLIITKTPWIHWSEPVFFESGVIKNNLKRISWNFYFKIVNKYALGAFANGQNAAESFTKLGADIKRIEYLFYTVEGLKLENKKIHFGDSKLIVLYVGELVDRKGIDTVLDAFALIDNKKIELWIVGRDTNNRMLNIQLPSIKYFGIMKSEEIGTFFQKADIFILPGKRDGWGVVINEAISSGLPVISTKFVGAARHLVIDNYNGFLIEPSNPIELKNKIIYYFSNPDILKLHGKNSLAHFKKYDISSNVLRIKNSKFLKCHDQI